MKTTRRIPVIAVLALAAAAASAQTGKDREQVVREFDEARRNGELIVSPETGLRGGPGRVGRGTTQR
jgi:hypothetical protein